MPAAAAQPIDAKDANDAGDPDDELDPDPDLDWSDWTDAEGESYTSFAYEDDWPGPFGGASVGAP